jgi:hypothetical protein
MGYTNGPHIIIGEAQVAELDQDQVKKTTAVLLGVLESDNIFVPGTMLAGVASGVGMLRGILNGELELKLGTPPAAEDEKGAA